MMKRMNVFYNAGVRLDSPNLANVILASSISAKLDSEISALIGASHKFLSHGPSVDLVELLIKAQPTSTKVFELFEQCRMNQHIPVTSGMYEIVLSILLSSDKALVAFSVFEDACKLGLAGTLPSAVLLELLSTLLSVGKEDANGEACHAAASKVYETVANGGEHGWRETGELHDKLLNQASILLLSLQLPKSVSKTAVLRRISHFPEHITVSAFTKYIKNSNSLDEYLNSFNSES